MTNMVEKVARAICFSQLDIAEDAQDDFWANPRNNPFMIAERREWDNGQQVRWGREDYRTAARAAIAAMREPTDEMVEKGAASITFIRYGDEGRAERSYRAMIDAALNPSAPSQPPSTS